MVPRFSLGSWRLADQPMNESGNREERTVISGKERGRHSRFRVGVKILALTFTIL